MMQCADEAMILNTKQKLLVLGMAAACLSVPGSAHANHGVGAGSWNHDDVGYACLSSVNLMPVESSTDPCDDFATAVDVWNSIPSSSLEFDEVLSSTANMTVGASSLYSGTWAVNQVVIQGGTTIVDSDIRFNYNVHWGDRAGADWWKFWVKDYLSTAIHETGHAIRLVHDPNSELMRGSHGIGEIYRTPSEHDVSTVEGKYP